MLQMVKNRKNVVALATEKKFTTSYSGKEKRLFIHGQSEKAEKNFILSCQFKGLSQKALGFSLESATRMLN